MWSRQEAWIVRKRYFRLLPLLLLFLLLAGCFRDQEEKETGYKIYYVDAEGIQLQEVSYVPKAQTFEEIMDELAGQLADPPSEYVSVLKNGVKIKGYTRGIDALRIDFSKEYYSLNNIEEVLLRAAVVKTFSQIPGVMKVMITVKGQQLVDTDNRAVAAMDADDFINTKEGGINSYQNAVLSLYFVSKQTGRLEKETRFLHYSSNMVLENVVAEQLVRGPDSRELQPVFADTVKILGLQVQDGICTIDLDKTANSDPAEGSVKAETALYALVNSICDTCDEVDGVRIRIEGVGNVLFRDKVSLDHVFEMNLETAASDDKIEDDAGEEPSSPDDGEDVMEE